MRNFLKSPYNLFITFLVILNLLPLIAPILLELSHSIPILELPARVIYFGYSFTCHQFDNRSVHLFDHQVAWCVRDMGIWMGFLAGVVGVKYLGIKGIRWYQVLPFIVPIALDGGIQTIATVLGVSAVGATGEPLYISNNLVRMITGATFGVGMSLWLSGVLIESFAEEKVDNYINRLSQSFPMFKQQSARFLILVMGLVVIYTGLIFGWQVSSSEVNPSDFLDTAVKTPVQDFYVRRKNGLCPTTADDLFNFGCFFDQIPTNTSEG